ncbi:S24 family peptidase [Vibrio sinaloensis]|uniref:S24 family peptidase n=1 Tax=Photobacterium sp. (strain ATCC 43367) TaxID=379097 RepID=UPI002F3521F2
MKSISYATSASSAIKPTSLLAEFGLSPKDAAIIYVDSNSMEPTLSHKDRLLVDTRELQHPVTDGVYVIRIDDAVYVKRLKWNIPKGIYNVVSDNPEHESFEINHKNGRTFKVIGKALAPLFKKIF